MKKTKCFNFPTASILMLTLALAMSGNARAQVTIGANIEPQPFSVLELISNNTKGLRLPQMDSVQRNTMMATQAFKNEKKGKALGLRLFNTSTNCVNTWNGTKWIEECAPVTFPDTTDIYGSINIATFVNVMYDFQYQKMYVYQETGDAPVSYQWFVKRVGQADTEYKVISGAESDTYTIPVDFVRNVYQSLAGENNPYYKSDSIMFACVAKYADDKIRIGSMDILFIGTNTSGYGTENGVKYLTLDMGSGGNTVKQGSTAKMKMALLNLGQSADWSIGGGYVSNNNAADLGDFYQWGRVADGHQNTVWSKDADHRNTIEPFGTTPDSTSTSIGYYNYGNPPAYNSNHQVTDDAHYGKFIYSDGGYTWHGDADWYYYNNAHDDGLWGTATSDSRNDQGSLDFRWDKPDNNPCPLGWRIPSIWNWWDIVEGNGSDALPVYTQKFMGAVNNYWQLRGWSSNQIAYGGAIATNSDNEKIFLPIMVFRGILGIFSYRETALYSYCWSSTYSSLSHGHQSFNIMFGTGVNEYASDSGVRIIGNNKTSGRCVRCVAEPEPEN